MRKRRTNKELEEDIFNAFRKISKTTELSAITLSQVASEARIDLKVIRRRYPTEADLIEAYVACIDTKVSSFFEEAEARSQDKVDKYRYIFQNYMKWLSEDQDFRDLLIWELADKTNKGFESSQRRDRHLVELMSKDFEPTHKSTRHETLKHKIILYIAGITYLALYKRGQNFLGFDHKNRETFDLIDNILTRLLEAYFEDPL
ncbi:MAG: hypothetical protein Q4E10_04525 [Porphyromonas sp.]|nr:hypothetical protein [Porphyromonas sp.]